MDLDMALGSSLGLDIIMAPVAAQVTQICMVSVAAWPLDNNMVLGGWPDPAQSLEKFQ